MATGLVVVPACTLPPLCLEVAWVLSVSPSLDLAETLALVLAVESPWTVPCSCLRGGVQAEDGILVGTGGVAHGPTEPPSRQAQLLVSDKQNWH